MNILFIGNSYTYFHDLPAVFAALANENGKGVTAHSVTRGGRKLCQFMNAEDDATKELANVLADNPPFDAVFLQEQSMLPYRDYDAFFGGAKHVAEAVRAAGAKRVCFYVTWGRRPDCPTLDEMGWTHDTMTAGLHESYFRAAEALSMECADVGAAFHRFVSADNGDFLYDPDGSHPSYAGTALAALVMYKTIFGEMPEKTEAIAVEQEILKTLLAAVE
ncbi:MAG: hypothetical protein IJW77_11175 [Clostridia bacterium]|nr:hypothetical protein [Clostridia bacterium]